MCIRNSKLNIARLPYSLRSWWWIIKNTKRHIRICTKHRRQYTYRRNQRGKDLKNRAIILIDLNVRFDC